MITNMSIGRYGRFGNQLFQIAAAIGIARKSGQEFAFNEWINHDHKDRFGSMEDVDVQKYFVNPLPRLQVDARLWDERPYSWGYHDIYLPAGNWNLTGHFQSEKYFDHCIDEARHYLRMYTDITDPQDFDTVAIHVRRGDYDDKYHTILDETYYHQAIHEWPSGTYFVVYSDDMEAAMRMIWRTGHRYRIDPSEGKDYIEDFATMKNCGGFICGNSSFSLMAAILSEAPNKKIVCPSNWFGPAWNPDTKDLYPKNAIII